MPSSDFDRFDNFADTLTSPARIAFAITPSDTASLTILPKAIVSGTSGTVTLQAADSDNDVVISCVAGQTLPIRARYIRATGTSATGLVGLA
jgi:hypothetical protein